ncbi:hypothetical protein [Streptomyces thermovulgaris]|uniref:hypothetical protein n=1 Tax=Streptomyces thermovulgaris TaxID=1934 RepID=UPI000A379778|nr:hypothetical protein [Streptomyces thermovulgaris]
MREMLRRMEGGGPVELSPFMATTKKFAQLAFIAQQFGYEYVDIRQAEGRYVMLLVPDPSPQARARAAQSRERYPDAARGGALPPLDPEAVEPFRPASRSTSPPGTPTSSGS